MNTLVKRNGNTMKASLTSLRCLVALFAMVASPAVRAVWIEEEVATNLITVTASSEYGAGSGSAAPRGRRGTAAAACTTTTAPRRPCGTRRKARPRPPGCGRARLAGVASVRFRLAAEVRRPVHIWNHNQAGLTDRGFRRAHIYGPARRRRVLAAPEALELPVRRARRTRALQPGCTRTRRPRP